MKPILVTVLASLGLAVPGQGSPDSLTLEVDARTVTYGDVVWVSGVFSPASEGARVTVLALPYDGGRQATVTTPDAEGRWRLAVRPRVTTQFRAVAGAIDSADTPVVSVRPRVHLVVLSARRGLFYTRVEALSEYEGRTAAFQRLGARGWRTVEHARLGSGGAVRFRARSRSGPRVCVCRRRPRRATRQGSAGRRACGFDRSSARFRRLAPGRADIHDS